MCGLLRKPAPNLRLSVWLQYLILPCDVESKDYLRHHNKSEHCTFWSTTKVESSSLIWQPNTKSIATKVGEVDWEVWMVQGDKALCHRCQIQGQCITIGLTTWNTIGAWWEAGEGSCSCFLFLR